MRNQRVKSVGDVQESSGTPFTRNQLEETRRGEERRGEERREENVKIETNSVIEVSALGNVTKLRRTEEKCVPCFTKAISNLQYYSQGNIKQRQTL